MNLSKSVIEFHCLSYVKMLLFMKINQDNLPFIGNATFSPVQNHSCKMAGISTMHFSWDFK